MSASAKVSVINVRCSVKGCTSEFEHFVNEWCSGTYIETESTRAEAGRVGWQISEAWGLTVDICPKCASSENLYALREAKS